jgi:hypothetical protein
VISRLASSRLLRVCLGLLAVAFCAYGLVSEWGDTRRAFTQLSWPAAGGALVAGLAGLFLFMIAWRSLLAGLGSPLPLRAAVRTYFVGALGKYIPGSVWAAVGQMELAKEYDVPRERGASASILAMAVSTATGAAVAAVTLPLTSDAATHKYWWLLLLAPVFLACLHPRFVGFALGLGLRIVRRPPLTQAVSFGTMARATGWTALAFSCLGVHTWLLVRSMGGHGANLIFLAAGAYALAFTLGFLVVIAPSGLGIREAVLVITLGPPVLATGAPLVVAIASRVIMTVADLVGAGIALLLHRMARSADTAPPAEDPAENVRAQSH